MTISTTRGLCTCGTQRVCLVMPFEELLDEQGQIREPLVEKWACPACDVFPTFCIDDSVEGGVWDYVSRDSKDAAWSWLPEPRRAPLAKFGFTVGMWEVPATEIRVFFIYGGQTWVTNGKSAFSLQAKTSDEVSWLASQWAEKSLPGCRTREPAVVSAPFKRAPGGVDAVRVGTLVLPADDVHAVAEMYPGATWEAKGGVNPAVAILSGAPVAVVMPLVPLDGIIKAYDDKPHRCPTCGQIPDAVRATGGAAPGVVYECANDKTKWRLGAKEGRP